LQVQDFLDATFGKDMMAAFDAFLKAEMVKQAAHCRERNVRVSGAPKDLLNGFSVAAHR
jgi:hypothetical protein